MRVLVTGASGFIGRPLATALAAGGYQVRAAVRDRRAQGFPEGVETVLQPDLAKPVFWSPLVAGTDMVVHLAGIAHVGPDVPEAIYDRVNHVATAELARAATVAGVKRLVFMSSTRAQAGASAPSLTESAEPHPTDAYGRSKLAAEVAIRATGVPHTILRPALVYGANPKGNMASLMRLAALPIPLPFGAFANRRSLLAIDNLIAAVRFALEDHRAINETFLVADPEAISVAELVALLRTAGGRKPGLVAVPPAVMSAALTLAGKRDTIDRLTGSLIVEPKKLMAAGWSPVTGTAAGIAAMVQAASPRKSGTASRRTP